MATEDVHYCIIMATEVSTALWVDYGSRVRGCGVCGGGTDAGTHAAHKPYKYFN